MAPSTATGRHATMSGLVGGCALSRSTMAGQAASSCSSVAVAARPGRRWSRRPARLRARERGLARRAGRGSRRQGLRRLDRLAWESGSRRLGRSASQARGDAGVGSAVDAARRGACRREPGPASSAPGAARHVSAPAAEPWRERADGAVARPTAGCRRTSRARAGSAVRRSRPVGSMAARRRPAAARASRVVAGGGGVA